MLFFGPISILVAGLSGRHVRLVTPVCRRHRWHWAKRSIVLRLGFLSCFAIGIGGGFFTGKIVAAFLELHEREENLAITISVMVGGFAAMMGCVGVYYLVRRTAPRLRSVHAHGATFNGVAITFAEALAMGRSLPMREDTCFDEDG